jgi:hypothetical protein
LIVRLALENLGGNKEGSTTLFCQGLWFIDACGKTEIRNLDVRIVFFALQFTKRERKLSERKP